MTCKEVVKIFDSILDCEATKEEQDIFLMHMEKCKGCFEHYELDKLFKEYVKKHEHKTCCPHELLLKIKNQIKELPE